MDLEYNPLDEDRPASLRPKKIMTTKEIVDISLRQKPYFVLIEQFQALFYELPKIGLKDVDVRIKTMYDTLMETCEQAGISRISIPQLKECCGMRRVWPDENQHPGHAPILDSVEKSGLGDLIAKLTAFCRIKPCEGCERRRVFLNKFRWPWSK
jgi:hypothetical protein